MKMNYEFNDILDVLSESTLDEFFNLHEFDLFIEDGKSENSKDNKFKKLMDTASDKYMTGLNKRSESFAKLVVKKPDANATHEVQEKYEKKVLQARTAYKIGEILVSKAVLLGPLDMIATAAIVKGIANSDDPSDKMVADKLKALTDKANSLKEKANKLIDKVKGKKVTNDNFKAPYEAIQLQGKNIAKEIDAVKAKANKPATITESVLIDKFDEYLIKEDGSLVDNAYEILNTIVEKTDYTKYDIFPVVEHYINMII